MKGVIEAPDVSSMAQGEFVRRRSRKRRTCLGHIDTGGMRREKVWRGGRHRKISLSHTHTQSKNDAQTTKFNKARLKSRKKRG